MSALDLQLSRITRPASALAHHGGQVAAAHAAFPGAPEPWLDLSTGINPHAYPLPDLPPDLWRRLPDPEALGRLAAAARACYGAPDAAGLVAAPGTQALIGLLPRLKTAHRVAVLGFGYQEHPQNWRSAGAEVRIETALDACASADVAVVVNPNNPDGRQVPPAELLLLAERLARHDGLLIVDEAFADTGECCGSLVPRLAGRNVIVLRSFGKFFGMAGVRLGFAVGEPALCAALETGLGPWAVSGPAIAIGMAALADHGWQARMRETLKAEAARLDALLSRAGFAVLGGTSLFRLVHHRAAERIFDRLGRAGILVRPFRQRPTWLRFGLPEDPVAWDRLTRVLLP